MKYLSSILLLFSTTQLFSNYAFNDEKKVKIDIHGNKSEMTINHSGFSKTGTVEFKGLDNFTIKEPQKPNEPEKINIPELQDIELK